MKPVYPPQLAANNSDFASLTITPEELLEHCQIMQRIARIVQEERVFNPDAFAYVESPCGGSIRVGRQ